MTWYPENAPEYLKEAIDRQNANGKIGHDKAKDYWLRRSYGITLEEYENILIGQNRRCAICHAHEEDATMCLDHDHKTGRVRGILCQECNLALGQFQDNAEMIESALIYLRRE